MTAPALQSLRRRKRATVATLLLAIHARDELVEPESWTWELLDALPHWCLMDAASRRRLQAVCGAVMMAPALDRWIDPRCLHRAREVVGDTVFGAVLEAGGMADASVPVPVIDAPAAASDVEPLLLDAGATVLLATLHERFLVSGLSVDVGESLGPLPREIADRLLREAERLLAMSESSPDATSVPGDAAASDAAQVAEARVGTTSPGARAAARDEALEA